MTQLLQPPPMNRSQKRSAMVTPPTTAHSTWRSADELPFLTNEIPPYRVPLYGSYRKRLVGTSACSRASIEKSIGCGTCRSSSHLRRREVFRYRMSVACNTVGARKFEDSRQIHLPVGHFWDLHQFGPDVVISGELGARTLIGARCMLAFCSSPVGGLLRRHAAHRSGLEHKAAVLRRVDSTYAPHAYMVNGRQGRQLLGRNRGTIRQRFLRSARRSTPSPSSGSRPPNKSIGGAKRLGIHGECYLFCGALTPRKGLDQLLDAWEVFAQMADVDATLLDCR